MQKITSKNTSQNQLAGFYKKAVSMEILGNAEQILDYGCGKYLSKINQFAGENNFCVIGFDPFHLTEQENEMAVSDYNLRNTTHLVCNNVLNVLQDKDLKFNVQYISFLCSVGSFPALFTVYEGNKTGNGAISKKDCYQRNDKKAQYISYLERFFKSVVHLNGILICKNQ
jgi:hypothetical protein